MKVAALILGIIGGLIALTFGFLGFGLGAMANAANAGGGGLKVVSIAVPVVALIGAGFVMAMPVLGALMMGGAAIAFIAILGFGTFTMVPVVILGIAALLGFMASMEATSPKAESVKCEKCGGENVATDSDCRYCRAPLPTIKKAATEAQVGTPAADLSEQIARLKTLHSQGALDDAEFQAAKAKLLG